MSNAIVRFGANPPAVEAGKPANPISGDPTTRLQNYFTDASGQFFSGIWESTQGKWPVRYSESEFCAILEGKCVLTDASGKAETFGKGDSFVIRAASSAPGKRWSRQEALRNLRAEELSLIRPGAGARRPGSKRSRP